MLDCVGDGAVLGACYRLGGSLGPERVASLVGVVTSDVVVLRLTQWGSHGTVGLHLAGILVAESVGRLLHFVFVCASSRRSVPAQKACYKSSK